MVTSLADKTMEPGEKVISLDAAKLREQGAGIYFYRLEVGGQVLTRKLMMISR